jgi:ATP-dependent DNA helicase RecG
MSPSEHEPTMQYPEVESKILEFKEKLYDYTRIIETVTAFVNTQGGTIIIGIRDKDREIIGLSDNEIQKYHQEIPQAVVDAVSPQLSIDMMEQNFKGNTCLVLRVFPGPQKPYFIKRLGFPSGVYCRFGSHNRQADKGIIENFMRQKQGRSYEQELIPKLSFNDLSKNLLENIFDDCRESTFIGAGYGEVDASGRCVPNVAGTLLFCPEHEKHVPESYVSIAHYAGSKKDDLIKTYLFNGGLHHLLDTAYATLEDIFKTNYVLTGTRKRAANLEIPAVALREILVNAVAHRSYDIESPIRITIFSDRLEILNPGTFYAPIHPGNLKEGLSRYRNILIGDALRKTGHMEKQGIGISTVIESCLDAGLPEPQFIEIEQYLKVIISRIKLTNDSSGLGGTNVTSQMNNIEILFRKNESLSSSELAHHLGKSQAMAKKVLQQYQKDHLIEKIGKGPSTRYRWKE